MISPIKNQINAVFVHVSDLERSVKWYCQLLNQEYDLSKVSKPVYNVRINDYTGLTIDAGPSGETKIVTPSPYPLFNFHTNNIDESFEYVKSLRVKSISGIIRFQDFSYFTVSDPDENIIMICTG